MNCNLSVKKVFSLIIMSLIFSAGIFAESAIETALKEKDVSKVSILLESASSSEISDIEKAVIAEAKKAVSQDNLEYASKLAEAVLMNNFDNKEAQKLYTSIEKAMRTKAEAQERKAAEEKERKAKEAEKKQLEEFIEQKEKAAMEKEEYLQSVSSITRYNFPVSFTFSPAIFEFAKSPFANEYNDNSDLNIRYGMGGNIDAGFTHPYFFANVLAQYSYFPTDLSGEGTKNELKLRFSLGIPAFSKWLCLSAGFLKYNISGENVALYESISAPLLGIGIHQLKIGKNVQANFFADVNLLSFDDNEIDFVFDADMYIRYNLPVNLKNGTKIYIENNTFFNCIRAANKHEWSCESSLSAGVSFNVR